MLILLIIVKILHYVKLYVYIVPVIDHHMVNSSIKCGVEKITDTRKPFFSIKMY